MKSYRLIAIGAGLALLVPGGSLSAHPLPVPFNYTYRSTQTMRGGVTYTFTLSNTNLNATLVVYDRQSGSILAMGETGSTGTRTINATWAGHDANESRVFDVLVAPTWTGCGSGTLSVSSDGLSKVTSGINICAVARRVANHDGECFVTDHITGADPYLFAIRDNRIYWDDDGRGQLNSRLCIDESGFSKLITTAYSLSGQGGGTLNLVGHTDVSNGNSHLGHHDDPGNHPFTYVYRSRRFFNAGRKYTISTEDMRGSSPDTVLYVVDQGAQVIVRRNDDGGAGLSSWISDFIPTHSGVYSIIVRSYGDFAGGTFDLRIDGALVENDAWFGGARYSTHMKGGTLGSDGDCVSTWWVTQGDPYMYFMPEGDAEGQRFIMNDDGAGYPHPRVCLGRNSTDSDGVLIVGSYTPWTQGLAWFIVDGSFHY